MRRVEDSDGMDRPIRVAVVEDQPTLRAGFGDLIDETNGFRCVGRYASGESVLEGIEKRLPDVVLMDIGLPGISGIEAIRGLKERYPHLECIVLTVYDDDERIFEAMCAGATGYLLKKTEPTRLLEGILEARDGGAPMSPEIARRVVRLFRGVQPPRSAAYDLTPHELRILKLLVDGHGYRTAAEELDVSVNTVRFHIKQIYGKLQVHSKSEAVSKALRSGLLT